MRLFCQIYFFSLAFFIFFPAANGELYSFGDDDEDANVLLSKKSKLKAGEEEECSVGDVKCTNQPQKSTPELMDDTAQTIVDLYTKYAKEFTDGKVDFNKLLESEYAKKIVNLLMHGNLPGGNPMVAAGFKLFQTFTKSMTKWNKGLKDKGLNLKEAMDELHEVVNKVVPGIVIAAQHSDPKCRKHALCRAARTAADTKGEIPQAVSLFFSQATASYLDMLGKSKKGDHTNIVECCSSNDKAIHKKCSAKYVDAKDCSSERLLTASMLRPIDYSQLEFLKTFLPKFK